MKMCLVQMLALLIVAVGLVMAVTPWGSVVVSSAVILPEHYYRR